MAENEITTIPGVGPGKAKALIDAGYDSFTKLARAKIDDLLAELKDIGGGIGETGALKLIGYAQEKTGIGAPRSAMELMTEFNENSRFITTGSKELDRLLGGGIRCGYTYEIAAKNGAGKTQLASQIACWTVAPKELGGLGGKVLFIDTENTGKPITKRWFSMLKAIGCNPTEYLGNIHVVSAVNSEMQVNAVSRVLSGGTRYDCVIIDGLMTKLRPEFSGRGNLGERQNILSKHCDELNELAQTYDTAVIFTNQVMDKPDMMYGDPTTPIGGHVVGHAAKYRVYMRRAKETQRVVSLTKAPDLPEGQVIVRVTDDGVTDDKVKKAD